MISVIVPAFNCGDHLIKTLMSLEGQSFKDFEVIIVDDGSTDNTQKLLDQYLRLVPPFLIKRVIQEHRGANVARNEGFKQSKGEYVLFLDADKILKTPALENFLKALLKHPKAAYVYSRFMRDGVANESHEFDAELLRKHNYIDCCSLIRRGKFPFFDPRLKRMQDWDLWLTMLERGDTGVLLKETLFDTVTRSGDITSTEDLDAAAKFIRRKFKHKAEKSEKPLAKLDPVGLVDIFIVRYGTPKSDKACFTALLSNTEYLNYRMIWYNNFYKKYPLSKVWNMLIGESSAEYICLLHTDTKVAPGWLTKLVETLASKGGGAVGPSTNECWTSQKVYKYSKTKELVDFQKEYGKAFQLSDFCLVFPRRVWEEVGGFNEDFDLHAETEFLHKVQEANYKTVWRKDAYVWHKGGGSSKKRQREDKGFDILAEKRRANKLYAKAIKGPVGVEE